MGESESTNTNAKAKSLTGGLIVLGIGIVFLLSNFGILPGISYSWPFFLIVVGVALLIGATRSQSPESPNMATPSQPPLVTTGTKAPSEPPPPSSDC